MDETYVRIAGKNKYLFRAVDSQGQTVDFFVRNAGPGSGQDLLEESLGESR
jgi:putative transposase